MSKEKDPSILEIPQVFFSGYVILAMVIVINTVISGFS